MKDKLKNIKLKNFEEKKKVLERRAKLKGSDIVLGDDWTEREKEIQKKIKRKAMEAKKDDPNVDIRIAYGKVRIGKAWYKWDEEQNKIVFF